MKLKNNNLYDKFIKYTDIDTIDLEDDPVEYFFTAFTWEDTKEGYDFWKDVNNDWTKWVAYWKEEWL